MKYDFDFTTEAAPRGSCSVKWDSCDEGVIPMWVAEMDFPAAPCIIDALKKRVEKGVFGYTEVPASYYESVIRWFGRRHGWSITREQIIPVQGIVPATSIAIKALTKPGDKVVFNVPAYNCFFHNITNQGCETSESRLVWNGEKKRYEMDFEDIERRCSDPAAKAFLLCNPHNPSGRMWSREELVRLGEICLKHGVAVISDEIHCEIAAPGRSYVPFASISEEFAQNCISFVSPTKGFNLAGVQIANIISANEDFRARMDRVINIWEHCDLNQFGIVALQAAYSDEGAAWLEEMNSIVNRNFVALRDLFAEEFPEVKVPELEATYLLWLDFSAFGPDAGKTVSEYLLKNNKVRINGGAMYGGAECCRINLACPEATMKKGLRRIAEGLENLRRCI
ncbi:MAG: pyridoxal phosphate-dependent aminotransferase [Bacteroidales bacterium]|nr:pyridoxal phosphate-dependent aminotransferase [Bacteroidales bacterium]